MMAKKKPRQKRRKAVETTCDRCGVRTVRLPHCDNCMATAILKNNERVMTSLLESPSDLRQNDMQEFATATLRDSGHKGEIDFLEIEANWDL